MEIIRDYFSKVKLPIISLIVLFFVHSGLIYVVKNFAEASLGQDIVIPMVTIINFTFILSAWIVICWAGIRTTRANQGGAIDGAIGGMIAAVVAGFIVRVISLLFSVSAMPALVAYSALPGGSMGGFFEIVWSVLLIIAGFFVDLVAGALFGGIGGIIHTRKILQKIKKRDWEGLVKEDKTIVVKDAKIVNKPKGKKSKKNQPY